MIKNFTHTLSVFAVLGLASLDAIPSQADSAKDWEWIEQNKPTSLVKNGDFETTTDKGTLRHWNTWSRHDSGTFVSVPGVEGNGAQVSAPKPATGSENSVLSQNIPVQASKKYVGVVWVRAVSKEYAAGAGISLRFRDDKGWWQGEPSVIRSKKVVASGEWQKLLVSATVPEGVTGVGLLLGASNGKAVYDNAALYEVP